MSTIGNADRIQNLKHERSYLVAESKPFATSSEAPDLTDDAIQALIEELRAVRLRIHAIYLVLKERQVE